MIHFDNVTKTYPNQSRPALESVNLDVEKGEFVFLVGPSGSGKSTFLRLVLREERPTEGRIYVAGRDLARLTNWKVPQLRRRIGCVFQDFRLLPAKNVYQNIAFALEVIGKPRRFIRKVVPEVIDLVGLEGKGDRMPDELSGGEQQRVAMARAFVNRPMILLADEPTGNIDPATSIGIMKVLDRINRTGTTVVMATHDAAIVDSMRKRVIELEYGKVVRRPVARGLRPGVLTVPQATTEGNSYMRAQFVFGEVWIGLRRNLTMTVALVVVVAISLSLLGTGLLFVKQVDHTRTYWQSRVQLSVYLCTAAMASPRAPRTDRSPPQSKRRSGRRWPAARGRLRHLPVPGRGVRAVQDRAAQDPAFVNAGQPGPHPGLLPGAG